MRFTKSMTSSSSSSSIFPKLPAPPMLLAFRTVQLHTRSRSVPNTTSFLCPARRCPFNDTSQVRHFSSDSQSQQAPPPPRRSASSVALALLVLALPSAYWYYDSRSKQALSITRFVPCPITHIQPLTPQTSIFTVALPASFAQPPPTHALTALYVAQPEIQIQRPFTPLYPLTPESTHVQLLVKRYDEKGAEMSQYIHRQQVGDELLLRGPEVTWHIDPDAKHLSFIAGGTGVTPFVQLVRHLRNLPASSQPSLSLLYASSTSDRAFLEADLRQLLKTYAAPWTLHCLHTRAAPSEDPQAGKLDVSAIQPLLPQGDSKMLVCGPDAMVAAVAGPASPVPGRTAPIGGMLRASGVKADQVVRL